MSKLFETIAEDLHDKFPNRTFITSRHLQEIAFFGSKEAARKALKSGLIPCIRVSSRRTLIPISAVLDFIQKHLEENECERRDV